MLFLLAVISTSINISGITDIAVLVSISDGIKHCN